MDILRVKLVHKTEQRNYERPVQRCNSSLIASHAKTFISARTAEVGLHVQSNVGQMDNGRHLAGFKCGWRVVLRFVHCGSLIGLIDANQKIGQLNQY